MLVMNQGNVYAFKDDKNKQFVVFELDKDGNRLNEYKTKDKNKAIDELFKRVGIDPTKELKEPKEERK